MYDFEFDGAPDSEKTEVVDVIGYCGGDIVLHLCAHLPKYMNFKIYFDNYFTYMELLIKLQEYRFWAVGTLRKDRMRNCSLKSEKDLKKIGCGAFEGAVDRNSGITIVRWLDNKPVQLASNYVFIEPTGGRRRRGEEMFHAHMPSKFTIRQWVA